MEDYLNNKVQVDNNTLIYICRIEKDCTLSAYVYKKQQHGIPVSDIVSSDYEISLNSTLTKVNINVSEKPETIFYNFTKSNNTNPYKKLLIRYSEIFTDGSDDGYDAGLITSLYSTVSPWYKFLKNSEYIPYLNTP